MARGVGLTMLLTATVVGCALAASAQTPPAPPSNFLAGGYLTPDALPDSAALVSPPPAPGSEAMARDEAAANDALKLHGHARWQQAMRDADLFSPQVTTLFSCAAGVQLGTATPHTDALLHRAARDLALATYAAKRKYMRARPFMLNKAGICTPEYKTALRHDGSYPSGHSAIGYGWGVILARLLPERADALLARGRDFGESRRVCNVHWESDIVAGQAVAAAVVTRLEAEPAFRADAEAAHGELTAVGAPRPDASECRREAAALTEK